MATALIVGSAPCVRADLAAAQLLRPDADVIAVNFSVALVHGRIAVTHHPENAERMKRLHRETWGDEVAIHMPKKVGIRGFEQHVDRIWTELGGVGGTSAWGAARMARLMGYDEAILCGCPLEVAEPGGRYHDEAVHDASVKVGAPRDRGEPFSRRQAVSGYQQFIISDAQKGNAQGIRSMSGWTRKKLGAPDVR